jgi:hypothetical protein
MNKTIFALGTVAWLVGCASQAPSTAPAPVAPPTAAPAAAATAPAASTTATAPEPAAKVASAAGSADDPAAVKLDPSAPPAGWKSRKRSGQTVYCKTVNVTGSMFPQEACLTPEQLEQALRVQKTNAKRTLEIPMTTESQQ